MLQDHYSPLSRYKLLFLALAVLLVLDQASTGGWFEECNYSVGRCRIACKENEKPKGTCVGNKLCCLPVIKQKSSAFARNKK
ncbi:unnamed protein product [Pipistrellus nathusii]|uniref:Beta-defensin n=1 Tax=Pipistrellus nathusii TaxID=59473 RepID=A0ABP0AE25_PIPNA